MIIELYGIIEFLVLGGIILYLVMRNSYLKDELEMREIERKFDEIIDKLKKKK